MSITYKNILRKHGLKATSIRLKVFELLASEGTALSHAEISSRLGDNGVDKVTLYRTLNSFTEKGLAHKVATEDRNWLYAIYERELYDDLQHDHDHAHFVCDDCDKIYCLPVHQGALEINENESMGFKITSKEIRLHGVCPVCR